MTRIWPCARPDGPRQRDTVLAGAACGVAFSTHYYCVFLAIPLALVIVQGMEAARLERLPASAHRAAALTSFVVFLALSPFLLVEPLTAWRDITANRQIVIDRAVASGAFAPSRRATSRCCWRDTARSTDCGARRSSAWCGCWPRPRRARSCCWHFRSRSCCSSRTPRRRAAISTRWCRFSRCSRRGRSSSLAPGFEARRRRSFWLRWRSPRRLASRRACDRTPFSGRTTRGRWRERYIEANLPAGIDHPDAAVLRRR